MHRVIIVCIVYIMCVVVGYAQNTLTVEKLSGQKHLLAIARQSPIPNIVSILQNLDSLKAQQQVYAIASSYAPSVLQKVEWRNNDVVFTINDREVWYANGNMVFSDKHENIEHYNRIIYPYNTNSLPDIFVNIPKPRADLATNYLRASDFQIAVVNGMPSDITEVIDSFYVLSRWVSLHPIAGKQAVAASKKVQELAKNDKEIQKFISELKSISGYVNRKVRNSSNISMHAFGLALDFIPYDYKGKFVYWQWTKVLFPDTWAQMPLSTRWIIPDKIVEVFEEYGFIWGGKWPNYDMVHMEYRPEILAYSDIRALTGDTEVIEKTSNCTNNSER